MLDSPWDAHAETLLGRPELQTDFGLAASFLRGRRLLVTGAGGSVGRALSLALAEFHPRSLVLLDHHEHSLFDLSRRLGELPNGTPIDYALTDVRNERKVRALFGEHRPEVVFHLAATKHVPLAEKFPDESVDVNVFGTLSLVRLATELATEVLLYTSSDKACNPPSLYGATKRLAETLVQQAAQSASRRFSVVRYVNILGSQGSVLETFADQLRRSQPMTITSPEMTRYWISMREAVWLITSAACWAESGRIYMLDARQEVTVVEMAQRVAGLLGFHQPQQLAFTQVRPGERLREELLGGSERFAPGPQPGVLVVNSDPAPQRGELLQRGLSQLQADLEACALPLLRQHTLALAQHLQ